jgi:hypothetical protein
VPELFRLRGSKDVKEFYLAVRAIGAIALKASSGASAGCNELLPAQDTPDYQKNPMRESQTERTAPTLVSHILVRRVRGVVYGSARPQWKVGPVLDLRLCGAACASEESGTQRALLLITVSLERMKSSE